MRLQDVMSTGVTVISPNDSADEALYLMHQQNIHHLVVLEGRNIIGILSSRDLENIPEDIRRDRDVRDYMTSNLITAEPHTTLKEAANLMRGNTIGCLPIVENNRLVGIITTTDLLELVGRGTERITGDTDRQPIRNALPSQRIEIH